MKSSGLAPVSLLSCVHPRFSRLFILFILTKEILEVPLPFRFIWIDLQLISEWRCHMSKVLTLHRVQASSEDGLPKLRLAEVDMEELHQALCDRDARFTERHCNDLPRSDTACLLHV